MDVSQTQHTYVFDDGSRPDPFHFVPVGQLADSPLIADGYHEAVGGMVAGVASEGKRIGYVLVGVFATPPQRIRRAHSMLRPVGEALKFMREPLRIQACGWIPISGYGRCLLDRYVWLIGWDFPHRAAQFEVLIALLKEHGLIPKVTFTDQDHAERNLWHMTELNPLR